LAKTISLGHEVPGGNYSMIRSMHRGHLFLGICLFIYACTDDRNGAVSRPFSDTEYEKVQVQLFDTIYLSQIALDISYLPLETNDSNMIGQVTSIIGTEELYIVADEALANSVFGFSKNGRNTFAINKTGGGEGEYGMMGAVNLIDDRIVVFDISGFSALSFGLDGQFLEEWKVGYYVDYFIQIDRDRLAFVSVMPNVGPDESGSGTLHFCRRDFSGVHNSFFPLAYGELAGEYGRAFFYEGNTRYVRSAINRIYNINGQGEVSAGLLLDFGEYNVPDEIFEKDGDIIEPILEQQFLNGEFAALTDRLLEDARFLSFWFYIGGTEEDHHCWLGIYDKETHTCLASNHIVNDIDHGPFTYPLAIVDNQWISVIDASAMLEYKEVIARKSGNRSLIAISDTIQAAHNPVLMKYSIKMDLPQ
jgi:hypothetical protein